MDINTVEYYDGIAEGYDELYFEEQKKKFDILKENMNISEGAKVLDVGCGTFFSFDYFRDFFNGDIYGIEPSSKMVKLFVKAHPKEKSRIKVGFAEELSENYKKDFFDAIICVSVAHHFRNQGLVFGEMKKVCRSSAVLGITILRDAGNFKYIEQEINNSFRAIKRIDSPSSKDVVFICKMK